MAVQKCSDCGAIAHRDGAAECGCARASALAAARDLDDAFEAFRSGGRAHAASRAAQVGRPEPTSEGVDRPHGRRGGLVVVTAVAAIGAVLLTVGMIVDGQGRGGGDGERPKPARSGPAAIVPVLEENPATPTLSDTGTSSPSQSAAGSPRPEGEGEERGGGSRPPTLPAKGTISAPGEDAEGGRPSGAGGRDGAGAAGGGGRDAGGGGSSGTRGGANGGSSDGSGGGQGSGDILGGLIGGSHDGGGGWGGRSRGTGT